jgi:RNA polymerase sigma-70 factor (ECF subfamily)
MDKTPISLLERLRASPEQADHAAWARFVQLYTPLIYYWCRRCGLQMEDSADLTQEVFTTLVTKLPEFCYAQHKSFRGWLRTVTLNRWRDLRKRRATRPVPGAEAALHSLAGPDDISVLEETEYRSHILARALHIMEADFQPTTWRAFWECTINGRSVAEVAAELGLSPGKVYGARFRVITRLREELQGLLE